MYTQNIYKDLSVNFEKKKNFLRLLLESDDQVKLSLSLKPQWNHLVRMGWATCYYVYFLHGCSLLCAVVVVFWRGGGGGL